ncbi:hypothetical protein HOLleu_31989 [Holothuria leucospilota]|uniref:DNA-directed DNA polymerase n=1 Tax=Holothuria leucospilota TaxID=206669 RepID=A0A9Q1BGN1_HOLLE|nr:hypothetical protein HOLleu_31989 [Holothuria leucospilota]
MSMDGYQYVEIWEHEWQDLKKTLSSEMKAEIAKFPRNLDPLVPREAFFGGRTNGIKLYYEVKKGEQIKYLDFCSLYPFTNKYCSYPIGHPKILTRDLSHDITKYYGLVRFKQEASGWPDWCVTEVDRQRYLTENAANEGIKLEPSKIEKNPGLRALAKLMLNSFWGKFGQHEDLVKTEIVSEPGRLYDLMKACDETEVKDVRVINDGILEVQFKDKQNFTYTNSRVNVVIAAFTTCHARLRLYDVIDRLSERVLYFDKDSVMYISRPGDWDPPTGDYLGDLTNEISPKDGNFIRSFVTGCPKNYAYTLDTGKSVCTVRGIT